MIKNKWEYVADLAATILKYRELIDCENDELGLSKRQKNIQLCGLMYQTFDSFAEKRWLWKSPYDTMGSCLKGEAFDDSNELLRHDQISDIEKWTLINEDQGFEMQ